MLRSQEHPRCELSVQVRGSLRQVHLSVSSKLKNTVWAFCTRGPGLHPACCMQLESRHIELHSTQSELIQFVRLHFSISLFLLLKMAANLKVCSTIFSPLHVLSALWISCLLFCLVKVKLSPKCKLGVFFCECIQVKPSRKSNNYDERSTRFTVFLFSGQAHFLMGVQEALFFLNTYEAQHNMSLCS